MVEQTSNTDEPRGGRGVVPWLWVAAVSISFVRTLTWQIWMWTVELEWPRSNRKAERLPRRMKLLRRVSSCNRRCFLRLDNLYLVCKSFQYEEEGNCIRNSSMWSFASNYIVRKCGDHISILIMHVSLSFLLYWSIFILFLYLIYILLISYSQ